MRILKCLPRRIPSYGLRTHKAMNPVRIGNVILASMLCSASVVCFHTSVLLFAQFNTDDHIDQPGFWPRKSVSSSNDYAGSSACSRCHALIVASQSKTPMAATLFRAKDSAVLQSHPQMNFVSGSYHYEIRTTTEGNAYSVTDGASTLTVTLAWAFGSGPVGQSFLFNKLDGSFYEARVSYFDSLNGLNLTPGFVLSSPSGFDGAAYRSVGTAEIIRCFSCHSTGSTINGRFDASHLLLGVSCEACHGPGKQHVEAMKAATTKGKVFGGKKHIFNPADLKPAYSVDFCGSCHGAYWDVALMPIEEGLETTRFQPYRLQESKCWGKDGDPRLTCTSCHDPHQPLNSNTESYDPVCLSCHRVSGKPNGITDHTASACPIRTKNCSSCHMPNIYFAGMHQSFHDHRIQVIGAKAT